MIELEQQPLPFKRSNTLIIEHKDQQISSLEHAVASLKLELELKMTKISLVEQGHQLALVRIEQLSKQFESSNSPEKLQQVTQQLEVQTTTNNIIKHHCNKLTVTNEGLTQSLQDCEQRLSNALLKLASQQADFDKMVNSHTEQGSIIGQQQQAIKRLENDLKHTLTHYYEGVINTEKKLNLNIPS
jgi:chromosome segregation ATPase